jgi:hypothetical protein
MNDQTLQDMKQRITDAEDKKRRVENLSEAVQKVESQKVTGLRFPLRAEPFEMFYQFDTGKSGDEDRWFRVCWFNKEDGLTEEIHNAILDVLRARLAAAKEDWESA